MFLELHPLVIHFPIALFSSAVLFDCVAIVFKNNELLITSWWVMLLALFSSVFAIITGLIDDNLIGHLFTTLPLWDNHGLMQIISIVIFLSIFIWRTKQPDLFDLKKYVLIYLLIGLTNVVILFYGSHIGAILSGRV